MPRSKATTSTYHHLFAQISPCSPNELSHFSRVSQLFPLWACLGSGCSQINIRRSKVGRFGISERLNFFLQLIGSDSKVLTPIDANLEIPKCENPINKIQQQDILGDRQVHVHHAQKFQAAWGNSAKGGFPAGLGSHQRWRKWLSLPGMYKTP